MAKRKIWYVFSYFSLLVSFDEIGKNTVAEKWVKSSEFQNAIIESKCFVKNIFQLVWLKERSAECLPLCESWQYNYHLTFVPLQGQRGNVTTVISNEVIVTLDSEYRIEKDVLKMDLMTFFSSIGVGLGCILGMSGVTFVQAVVWVTAAIVLVRRSRRIAPL